MIIAVLVVKGGQINMILNQGIQPVLKGTGVNLILEVDNNHGILIVIRHDDNPFAMPDFTKKHLF